MNNIPKIKLPSNIFGLIKLSGKIVNPKRDWTIILILSVIFIVTAIGFDAYMYLQIISGDMYVSVQRNELIIENLKTSALQDILNTFESKKANLSTLKTDSLVDPSI
jgi:cell division protein FtsI/penicillin-binding protein 2